MKVLRITLQFIAWIGALIVGLSVVMMYGAGGYNVDMVGMAVGFSATMCFIGVFFLLLGGLISRGRFLWMITLLVGIAYIAVLPRVWVPHETKYGRVGLMSVDTFVISAFPGVVCIIGGIWMRSLDT